MMIQSYYGNGKGKTTAAIGAAIRCAGSGQKVMLVQFLKNNDSSEYNVLRNLENIDILASEERYELYDNLKEERTKALSKAYSKLLFESLPENIKSYQMVILDEILDAIEFGYVSEDKFLDLLKVLRNHAEIILTGHTITDKLASLSDYISQIKEVKHPYKSGVGSRKGIEY